MRPTLVAHHRLPFFAAFLALTPLCVTAQPRVSVTLPSNRATTAQDGRLLFLLSKDSTAEPRFQIQFGA